MANHRLGGADHRLATGGVGSSPAGSTFPKTTNKRRLRQMLRARDRQMHFCHTVSKTWCGMGVLVPNYAKIDQERKLIRLKLKEYSK